MGPQRSHIRATHDQIPLLSVGVGRADAADGRVFPYVFNPPTSYWSQNTAKIRFIGQQVGGAGHADALQLEPEARAVVGEDALQLPARALAERPAGVGTAIEIASRGRPFVVPFRR